MLLQTYTVIAELDTGEPVNVGDTVYEWPYENWGLSDEPQSVVIFTRLREVVTIYAVPARCLRIGDVIEAKVKVGAMTCLHTNDETTRIKATERPRFVASDEQVRAVALMLASAYWRGTFHGCGNAAEEFIRLNAKRTMDEWVPSARLALSF